MKFIMTGLIALTLVSSSTAGGKDLVYEGTWVTTNRPLDGPLTCVISDLGDNRWQGHFSGSWNGSQFSYVVEFFGPPGKLQGTAVIDGADYEWTGKMSGESPRQFVGEFGGNRYAGSFTLKQKAP